MNHNENNPKIIETIKNDKNLEENINSFYKELNNQHFFRNLNSKLLKICKDRRNKIYEFL